MTQRLKTPAGILLGLGLLWFVFRGTDWGEVARAIRGVDPVWIALAQAPIWASFFVRIRRWSYVVRTAGPVPYRTMFSATQIGFLANSILPGRAGEIIRAVVLARLATLSLSRSLAMAALDRVSDLVGLLAVLGATVYAFRRHGLSVPARVTGRAIPSNLVEAALGSAGAAVVGAVAVLFLLYVNQRLVFRLADALLTPVSARIALRVRAILEQFATGLHVFRSARDLAAATACSLVVWGCFVAANEAILRAFHLDGPWYTPFVYTTFVALAISIPGAPGFVGQYHFAVVATLAVALPHVGLEQAKAVALTAHIVNIIPVLALGLFCLYRENMNLFVLRRQGERNLPGNG